MLQRIHRRDAVPQLVSQLTTLDETLKSADLAVRPRNPLQLNSYVHETAKRRVGFRRAPIARKLENRGATGDGVVGMPDVG